MTNANTNAGNLDPLFHPAAHYASAEDVLNDDELSAPEKRIILSSWASDMFAVESCPALREVPGMGHTIRLADILASLRKLDGDDDPPPPGGRADAAAAALGRRPAKVGMMLTQTVVTMVLLGRASATWAIPFIAFMSRSGNRPARRA